MEGITILNQTDVVDLESWYFGLMLLVIGVFFISSVKVLAFMSRRSLIICIISFIIIIILAKISPRFEKCDYTKYEVTIDKNVSMIEFYNKYEVLEQHGEIWVIKEKIENKR